MFIRVIKVLMHSCTIVSQKIRVYKFPSCFSEHGIFSSMRRSLPEWQRILQARGILEQAIAHGWFEYGGGWKYLLYTEDGQVPKTRYWRWKRFKEVPGKPKYLWIPNKSPTLGYYHAPNRVLRDEVAKRDNVLYVANGEPSALAFRSAGLHNVVCWFGEKNIPPSLVQDCRNWGVKEVINFPDADDTGAAASHKLLRRFSGSKITYTAYSLPTTMRSKSDINDVWRDTRFHPQSFCDELARMDILHRYEVGDGNEPILRHLPKSLDVKESHKYSAPYSFGVSAGTGGGKVGFGSHRSLHTKTTMDSRIPTPKIPRRLHAPIASFDVSISHLQRKVEEVMGFTINDFKDNGWSKRPVACPGRHHQHDDVRPATYWNTITGKGYCHKCGSYYSIKTFANAKLQLRVSGKGGMTVRN